MPRRHPNFFLDKKAGKKSRKEQCSAAVLFSPALTGFHAPLNCKNQVAFNFASFHIYLFIYAHNF